MATKTITLTGAELAVTGLDGANAHIRNDGTDVIYAAKAAGISAGADGVLSIPAGQAATVYGISGTVYMLGTGSAQIISNDYSELPFKTSATSGGSGADELARAAINAHSGNAEIHVTADEKAKWNAKAELSDIPTTLPANGGNADTLGNIPASELERVRTAIVGGEAMGLPWTAMQARKDDTIIRVQADADYDRMLLGKSIDGGVTWTEIPLGNADTLDGKHADDFASVRKITTQAEVDSMLESGIYSVEGVPIVFGSISSAFYMLIVNRNRTDLNYNSELAIPYVSGLQLGVYYRNCNAGTWGAWTNVADGGNAATLETHPASDFVLKSDYDTLAARVAALEGGTT